MGGTKKKTNFCQKKNERKELGNKLKKKEEERMKLYAFFVSLCSLILVLLISHVHANLDGQLNSNERNVRLEQYRERAQRLTEGAKELVDQARELSERTYSLSERATKIMNNSRYAPIVVETVMESTAYLSSIYSYIESYGSFLFRQQS